MIGKVEGGKVIHVCPKCNNKISVEISELSLSYVGETPAISMPKCVECKTLETMLLTDQATCPRQVRLFAKVLRGETK